MWWRWWWCVWVVVVVVGCGWLCGWWRVVGRGGRGNGGGLVVPGDEQVLEQVLHQVSKLVDVIEVVDVTRRRHLNRELILVEVATTRHSRAQVLELATLFKARVAAVGEKAITLEMVGERSSVEDFLRLLKPYEITDISRSGLIAVARGEGV